MTGCAELYQAGTGSREGSEQGHLTLTGFPDESNLGRGVEGGMENVLGPWNCLLEGTKFKK